MFTKTYQSQFYIFIKKRIHFQPKSELKTTRAGFDNYSAHSPMNISRGRAEEIRSKLFFDSPQVPNRIPKYLLLFCCISGMISSVYDRTLKKDRDYESDREKKIFSKIAPFVQAMEDLRYTADEQRNLMINKAIADKYSPALFKHINKRFYQDDLFINEVIYQWRNTGAGGRPNYNSGIIYDSRRVETSYQDKGLFDNREIGFKA